MIAARWAAIPGRPAAPPYATPDRTDPRATSGKTGPGRRVAPPLVPFLPCGDAAVLSVDRTRAGDMYLLTVTFR